ncbi:hypothetical protein CPC16_003456 [Podila verticillata]|nr:hypothetical protein CPC16_003456 [Podila verticillata]
MVESNDTMKIFAIVALAAVAAVAHAQTTCWNQLRTCKSEALEKDISLGECQENMDQCQAEKANNAEETRCWKCAYTEVQRCVDASGDGNWSTCYKNGLRMRKFCLEG